MKKTDYMKDGEKFYKIFGQNLNHYCEILPDGELSFDIFSFENYLIGKGYDEECSMKDYIEKEFGTEASKFIEHLLN